MAIEKSIPNFLTLCNIFCGFLGLLFCFEGDLVTAGILIFVGALFDVSDGLVSRLLGVSSPIGKDLDSLADLVTFGVLPSVILHLMLRKSNPDWLYLFHVGTIPGLSLLAFLVAGSAALRLAKFNNDTTQKHYFRGLPSPSNAMFVAALPLIMQYDIFLVRNGEKYMANIVMNPYVLLACIILLTWLMNANIRLFSLKRKSLKWKDSKEIYILLIAGVIAFAFLFWAAIPLMIFLYVILSLIFKPQPDEI